MKCVNCGADIPAETMSCIYCGHSVQMVPDYNPLGDVLEEAVRSRIDQNEPTQNRRPVQQRSNTTTGRIGTPKNPNTNRERGNTKNLAPQRNDREAEMKKKREAERRRALKKKRRNVVIGILSGITILFILISYLIYVNSYVGQMNAGDKALESKDYIDAIEHYENAMSKKPSRLEPYECLIEIYIAQGDDESLEEIYLSALEQLPDNIDMNVALMEFYVDHEMQYMITDYLLTIDNENVKNALSIYEEVVPVFSLESGTYDDVQELTIIAPDATIYYTIDGSDPTEESLVYEASIQMSEGTTEVRAIAVNEKGVVSEITYGKYIIALPTPDAPIVSPSTGQYSEETYITVSVPDGCTAYYTTDSSKPYLDGELSDTAVKYKDAILMPEGNTIFSVVIISASGKVSDVTMRNYELIIEDEVEIEVELEEEIEGDVDEDEI